MRECVKEEEMEEEEMKEEEMKEEEKSRIHFESVLSCFLLWKFTQHVILYINNRLQLLDFP